MIEASPATDTLEKKELTTRILIADDEPVSRRVLEVKLKKWGYEVEVTCDGKEALEALQKEDAPPIAILDWMMPEMDGIDVCRRIRRLKPDRPLYLILLTGKGTKQDMLNGFEAGADEYLPKPFDPDELQARLRAGERLLELQSKLAKKVQALNLALAEREQAELMLRESEDKFRTVFNNTSDGLLLCDPEEKSFFMANNTICQMLGYTRDEILQLKIKDIHPPESLDEVMSAFEKQRKKEIPLSHNIPLLRKNGDILYADIKAGPIVLGDKTFMLGAFSDMTDLKKIEEEKARMEVQLQQAQKLESIGQLAAGIAHEINTPTQYVGDNIRFFQDSFGELAEVLKAHERILEAAKSGPITAEFIDELTSKLEETDLEYLLEEIPNAIKQSLEGVERVGTIVRAMKEFSHPGVTDKTMTDVHKAIENTIVVARNEWKYVAEMETDFDAAVPAIPLFAGPFNQVILNLITNAAHAIGSALEGKTDEKGKITISTRLDGDQIEIRIKDTGTGVPEAVRPRIFDPFFTTKEVGKGTGQGLTIAHSVIVDKHHGSLGFETEMGVGTTFIIRLPIKD